MQARVILLKITVVTRGHWIPRDGIPLLLSFQNVAETMLKTTHQTVTTFLGGMGKTRESVVPSEYIQKVAP